MAIRGTLDHPKTLALAGRLNIDPCFALGILESLWHFVGKYAPTGDITAQNPRMLAQSMRYTGDGMALLAALIETGWIDKHRGRLIIHDWHDYADEAVKKRVKYHNQEFASLRVSAEKSRRKVGGKSAMISEFPQTFSPSRARNKSEPVPEPEPEPAPGEPPREETETVRESPEVTHDDTPPAAGSKNFRELLRDEDRFAEFRSVCEQGGVSGSKADWDEARKFEWKRLDFMQRQAAIDGVNAKLAESNPDDPIWKSLPKNILHRSIWERRSRAPTAKTTPAQQEILENLKKRAAEEARP